MKGTIQKNGIVLGVNGRLYKPDMLYNDTILLARTSWSRMKIEDVVGRKVEFIIGPKGHAFNFKLI